MQSEFTVTEWRQALADAERQTRETSKREGWMRSSELAEAWQLRGARTRERLRELVRRGLAEVRMLPAQTLVGYSRPEPHYRLTKSVRSHPKASARRSKVSS